METRTESVGFPASGPFIRPGPIVQARIPGYFAAVDNESNILVVNEIYPSIQGESTYAGLPCVFVRLTGCNLRCTYCDTEYAFYEGVRKSIDEVTSQVLQYGIPLVEITGGEPLLQRGCATLAKRLLDAGRTVLVETSGALPIDQLPEGTIRIMDLKCPSSGESDKNDWGNIERLQPHDEVKFVVGDRVDYDWARGIMDQHRLASRCQVLFSTVFGKIAPSIVTGWMLDDKLPARFQLQMHKYIWDPLERGV
jgi:7-carboxy-7-deazaguanine synthase